MVIATRYTHFVQHFLESAERFFMHGYRVCYYVFTDDPTAIPQVPLGPGRRLGIIPIQRHSHWEEISTRRMEIDHRALHVTSVLWTLRRVLWPPGGLSREGSVCT